MEKFREADQDLRQVAQVQATLEQIERASSDWLVRYITLLIVIAAGAVFSLANLRLPIVRNALCYAKAALGIAEHHFNLFAIAHDRAWTSGKPIFFSTVAAPFVSLSNANTGTIVASAIGT